MKLKKQGHQIYIKKKDEGKKSRKKPYKNIQIV